MSRLLGRCKNEGVLLNAIDKAGSVRGSIRFSQAVPRSNCMLRHWKKDDKSHPFSHSQAPLEWLTETFVGTRSRVHRVRCHRILQCCEAYSLPLRHVLASLCRCLSFSTHVEEAAGIIFYSLLQFTPPIDSYSGNPTELGP